MLQKHNSTGQKPLIYENGFMNFLMSTYTTKQNSHSLTLSEKVT